MEIKSVVLEKGNFEESLDNFERLSKEENWIESPFFEGRAKIFAFDYKQPHIMEEVFLNVGDYWGDPAGESKYRLDRKKERHASGFIKFLRICLIVLLILSVLGMTVFFSERARLWLSGVNETRFFVVDMSPKWKIALTREEEIEINTQFWEQRDRYTRIITYAPRNQDEALQTSCEALKCWEKMKSIVDRNRARIVDLPVARHI